MNLTHEQMTGILDNIEQHIETRFFNPLADVAAWNTAWKEQRSSLLASASSGEFDQKVNEVLARLKSSHVVFFHGSGTRVPAHYALNATLLNSEDSEPLWFFLDVLEGGIAHRAGIMPGDALLSVSGVNVSPPELLECRGVQPDVAVAPTEGDLRAGRDPVLCESLNLLAR